MVAVLDVSQQVQNIEQLQWGEVSNFHQIQNEPAEFTITVGTDRVQRCYFSWLKALAYVTVRLLDVLCNNGTQPCETLMFL